MTRRVRRPDWLEGVPAPVLGELAAAVLLCLTGIAVSASGPLFALGVLHVAALPVNAGTWAFTLVGAGVLGIGMKWLDRAEDLIVASHRGELGGTA